MTAELKNKGLLTSFKNPYQVHGIVFDLASLLGNMLVIGSIIEGRKTFSDQTTGILLLAAVATQFIGALIKKRPLSVRLNREEVNADGDIPSTFMKVLLFFHFLIFTLITLLGLALIGAVDINNEGTFWQEDIWIALSLLVGFLTTYVVRRAGQPGGNSDEEKSIFWLIEYGADVILSFSVIVITRFMWEDLFMDFTNVQGIGLNGRSLVFLGALSLLFLVFYLPSRYLFMVEDYRQPSTWARMWLPMLPIVWTVLVG